MDIQNNQTQELFEKLYVKNAPSWALERVSDGSYKYHATQSAFSLFEQQQAEIELLKSDLAKAQAVPEWKDYTVESPRIDGPYQIFIMNQQLVAKWESPWGFSSIEDGDALNQELITHWSVLGNDPAIEPQEPAND